MLFLTRCTYAYVYVCASEHTRFQTAYSIEIKFGMHIKSHRRSNPIDFGEYRIYRFFTGVQKRINIHCGLRSEIFKSILLSERFPSIQLFKFDLWTGHFRQLHWFFTEVQTIFLAYYALQVQIIESVLVSYQFTWFSQNLISIFKVIILCIVLIFVCLWFIVLLPENKK